MRTTSLIPKFLLCKVSSAVCTCHTYDFHTQIDDAIYMETKGNKEFFPDEVMDNLNQNHLEKVHKVLSGLLSTPALVDESNFQLGCRRLMYVILMAMRDNFELLKLCNKQKSQKLDSKKIKETYTEEFEIDFVPAYISFLFGRNGQNIKQFAKIHDCQLRVLGKTKRIGSGYTPSTIVFQVQYPKLEQRKTIKEDLQTLMSQIRRKREKHNKGVLQYWYAKQKKYEARKARNEAKALKSKGFQSHHLGSGGVAKDHATDNYSTKYHHMLKEKCSRKQEKENPKPKILECGNSWCTNCFSQYSKDKQTDCKYHKGYIRNEIYTKFIPNPLKNRKHNQKAVKMTKYYWTCCNEVLAEDKVGTKITISLEDRIQSNKDTGCTTSKQHSWKPHKKANLSKNSGKYAMLGTNTIAVM